MDRILTMPAPTVRLHAWYRSAGALLRELSRALNQGQTLLRADSGLPVGTHLVLVMGADCLSAPLEVQGTVTSWDVHERQHEMTLRYEFDSRSQRASLNEALAELRRQNRGPRRLARVPLTLATDAAALAGGLEVTVTDGRVAKLEGTRLNPLTDGFICSKVRRFPRHLYGDERLLHPLVRLAVHIVVALIAIFGAGLVVETIGAPFSSGEIRMGWLAIPFAILVFVGGINAWNMIDGVDGLASVQAFIALAFLLAVAGSSAPALQAGLLALLCGIGAFFLFNLPFQGLRRHRTFLGDAGSMFLGLSIVWHALALSQGATAVAISNRLEPERCDLKGLSPTGFPEMR